MGARLGEGRPFGGAGSPGPSHTDSPFHLFPPGSPVSQAVGPRGHLGPGGGGAQADHAQPAGPARLAVRLLGPAPSRSQLLVVSVGPEPFPAWLLWAMEVGRRGHSFIEPQNTRQLFLSLSSPRVKMTAPRGRRNSPSGFSGPGHSPLSLFPPSPPPSPWLVRNSSFVVKGSIRILIFFPSAGEEKETRIPGF